MRSSEWIATEVNMAAQPFCGMVGPSPAMQAVFAQVRRAAVGSAPVLIAGETGTGKELIARAIHACGPRAAAPFVAVNCAALARELVESELFGHVRGAFSGAATDHLGLVRAAAGGTLFLDEISEMAPELQAKLLRVLQERVVRPVGAVIEVPVAARFVASTNRNPAAALERGVLRADLYYRLSAQVIVVPPLRERRDDLEALVGHGLAELNRREAENGSHTRTISAAALAALQRHHWPGNVRELFNAIEHAVAAASAARIEPEDLAAPFIAAPSLAPEPPDDLCPHNGRCLNGTLADGERAIIHGTLTFTGGNKRRAAQLLGISRKRLYAKLAKYGSSNEQ